MFCSYEGTYLSVPPDIKFKSIASSSDHVGYLEYQQFSCFCFDLKNTVNQAFSFHIRLVSSYLISLVHSRKFFKKNAFYQRVRVKPF
jgi:hypothetical protein